MRAVWSRSRLRAAARRALACLRKPGSLLRTAAFKAVDVDNLAAVHDRLGHDKLGHDKLNKVLLKNATDDLASVGLEIFKHYKLVPIKLFNHVSGCAEFASAASAAVKAAAWALALLHIG